jgi:hypothetical protein
MEKSLGATAKRLAIIVDLDETLCCLDVPVEAGVAVLLRIDRTRLEVHYVTSRTVISRDITERFLRTHQLPGTQNVHYCPSEITSLEHKRAQHESLSLRFDVIASIGDSFEEEEAARSAGIPFIIVDPCNPAPAWAILADRIGEFRD